MLGISGMRETTPTPINEMPIAIKCLELKAQIELFIPMITIDPRRITEIEIKVATAAPVIPKTGINRILVDIMRII